MQSDHNTSDGQKKGSILVSVNNVSKILWYIEKVAKEPILIDDVTLYKHKTSIKLQPTFFLQDGCNSCGCCCVPEDNVFTQHEFDIISSMTADEFRSTHPNLDPSDLDKLRFGLKQVNHTINGNIKPVYVYKLVKTSYFIPSKGESGKTIDRCTWAVRNNKNIYCKIHPVESITCLMPHLRIFYSKSGTVSLGISQFGRNWALGCNVEFYSPASVDQFNSIKLSRIQKLEHLHRCADDLGIPTYLPEIIDYINKIPFDRYEKYLNCNIIPELNKSKLRIGE